MKTNGLTRHAVGTPVLGDMILKRHLGWDLGR
jgi:hypothetical protein